MLKIDFDSTRILLVENLKLTKKRNLILYVQCQNNIKNKTIKRKNMFIYCFVKMHLPSTNDNMK